MINKDIELNKSYWDNFYKSNFKHTPSQFCVCVLMELPSKTTVVELGCGNGRDSLYFASQGYAVLGMDLSVQAIASCQNTAKQMGISHTSFICGDLSVETDIAKAIAAARSMTNGNTVVFYSRFVIHSLNDVQEEAQLVALGKHLKPRESIYFEFRTEEDATSTKHYGNHYRRYVKVENFTSLLLAQGFAIDYKLIGRGMAKFKEEDPCVARIIAVKQ